VLTTRRCPDRLSFCFDSSGTTRAGRVSVRACSVPRSRFRSVLNAGGLTALIVLVIHWWGEERTVPADNRLGGDCGPVRAVACSPDGRWLASAGFERPILVWEIPRRDIVKTLQTSASWTRSLVFSPDGSTLVAGCDDGAVRTWNVGSWTFSRSFPAHSRRVRSLAFSPDGALLATVSEDRTLRVWNTTDWRPIGILPGDGHPVMSAVFSHDGHSLITGGFDGTVRLWDVRSGASRVVVNSDRGVNGLRPTCLAISPDGRFLAIPARHGDRLGVWDFSSGSYRPLISDDRGAVLIATFSADGRTLIAGTSGGTVEFWNVIARRPGVPFRADTGIWALAVSPDGQSLFSGGFDGGLRIWDLANPGGEESPVQTRK
jgi:WD40 repeat protein